MTEFRTRGCLLAAIVFAAPGVFGFSSEASAKPPKQRRVDSLVEEQPDFSNFAKRRAANEERQGASAGAYFSLFGGYVSSEQNVQASEYVEDPDLEARVRAVADSLLPKDLAAKPDYKILFVQGESFSPTALATGAIIVPEGFLRSVRNEDAVAFGVGHELSHILSDDFKADETREALNTAAGLAVLAAGAVGEYGGRTGVARKTALAANSFLFANEAVLGPSWSRKQETEADELGYDLSMDYGKSQSGAFDMLQVKIDADEKRSALLDEICGKERGIGGLLLKEALESAIGIDGALNEGSDPGNPICAERGNLLAKLTRSHPDSKKRKASLQEYDDAFYGELEDRPTTEFEGGDAISAWSPNGQMARLGFARDALAALERGDCPTARALAKKSLKNSKDTAAHPRYANYRVDKGCMNRAAAIRHLEMIFSDPTITPPLQVYYAIADENMFDGEYEKALERVTEGEVFHGKNKFYPQRIRILMALGRTEETATTLAECVASKDKILISLCRSAATPPALEPDDGGEVADARTTIFASLLNEPGAAPVRWRLERETGLTLFAPTDAAFRKTGAAFVDGLRRRGNEKLLQSFLLAHIAVSEVDYAELGGAPGVVANIAGGQLSIDPNGYRPRVNGARVIVSGVAAANGRIEVVSHLLASPLTGETLHSAPAANEILRAEARAVSQ